MYMYMLIFWSTSNYESHFIIYSFFHLFITFKVFDMHFSFSGGNYESNVIFSPKSYLPRSATLNVTVDLFGESINIFEVRCLLHLY
jgi:hypothetical protein